jgi:hypothetical protein
MRSARYLLALGLAAALACMPAMPARASSSIEVWKSATCDCCNAWVSHLEANGFAVKANNTGVAILEKLRQQAGVPSRLAGCHSGKVEGYLIEGHVPASDIKRLLAEKPDAIGLTVPGMPIGSPGMEQGDIVEPYDVLLIKKDGSTEVFARH